MWAANQAVSFVVPQSKQRVIGADPAITVQLEEQRERETEKLCQKSTL